jgi:hypothetical protein
MDLALLVYAISLLAPLSDFLLFINIILATVIVILLIISMVDAVEFSGECWKAFKSKIIWITISFFLIGGIKVFIPNEKTAYIMVGAYTAQKIAQDPKVEQVGTKVLTIINQKLDSYVDEGLDEAKKVAEKKIAKELKKATE